MTYNIKKSDKKIINQHKRLAMGEKVGVAGKAKNPPKKMGY